MTSTLYIGTEFLINKANIFFLDDDLLAQLREVSADAIYDTIEFNEFLQMMSKQQVKLLSKDSLKDAFRYKIKSILLQLKRLNIFG